MIFRSLAHAKQSNPRLTWELKVRPLSLVDGCLFNKFMKTFIICSSIRSLRTPHTVVIAVQLAYANQEIVSQFKYL